MSVICTRCGRVGSQRNKLINCCGLGCQTKIHDNCLHVDEGRIVDGHLVWCCGYHLRETSAIHRENEQARSSSRVIVDTESRGRNQSQDINLIDTDFNEQRNEELLIPMVNEQPPLVPNLVDLDNANNSRRDADQVPFRSADTAEGNNAEAGSLLRDDDPTNTPLISNNNVNIIPRNVGPRRNNRLDENRGLSLRNVTRNVDNRPNPRRQVNSFYASSPGNGFERNQFIPRQSNYSRISNHARFQEEDSQFHPGQSNQFRASQRLRVQNERRQYYPRQTNNSRGYQSRFQSGRDQFNATHSNYSQMFNQTGGLGRITGWNAQQAVDESVVEMLQKFSLKELPEVNNSHIAWSTFYETYENTKNLFMPHENVTRIQKAIKDPEVLQIGGPNLFNIRTFDIAIQKINGRLVKNVSFINKEANVLQSFARMRPENYKKLSDFIDKVVNFNHLAEAYHEYSFTCNKIFINGLAEKLPIYLHNKWISRQSQLESNGIAIDLRHFVEVLELELPNIETKIQNSMLPGFDLDFRLRNERQRVHKLEDEASRDRAPRFDGKICWFHKSNYHPTHECRNLWEMSGESVRELARLSDRCNICGQSMHNPCPYKSKLRCSIEGCAENHHSLYCIKRKAKVAKTKNHFNMEDSSQVDIVDLQEEEEQLLNLMNGQGIESDNVQETQDDKGASTSQNQHYITTDDGDTVLNYHEGEKFLTARTSRVLLGVIVLRLEGKVNAAFLVDTGSTASLIEESLANSLGLYGPSYALKLHWTGDHKREETESRVVKIKAFKTHDETVGRHIYFRTVKNLKVGSQKLVAKEIKSKYPYLNDLELTDYDSVSGIIGIDNIWMFKNKLVLSKNHQNHMPIGIRCELGDYIMQSQYPLDITYAELDKSNYVEAPEINFSHFCQMTDEESEEFKILEEEALTLESFLPYANSREKHYEKLAVDIMAKNTKRIEGTTQFESALLWKESKIELPTHDSFVLSLRRWLVVEKNALAKGKFEECEAQLKNLLEKNYARELTYDEINLIKPKTFYIPIFFISPEGKRTRMIWDLAAKVNNRCLNDELLGGPNLYNDILKINFQMSEHPYLLKGDVQEMFHQVRLKEEDTDSLRFIFRFKGEGKIRVFKMLVLPFGARCSPAISKYVKNLIAYENLESKDLAAKVVLNSTYVDDVVKSFRDKEVAKETFHDIRQMLKSGGFSLLKINSNDKTLTSDLRKSLAAEGLLEERVITAEKQEKLLGYNIDFEQDTVSLALNLSKLRAEVREGKVVPTKRELVRILMSIYDPVGLVQFVTSKLKLLYRKTYSEELDWDDKISDAHLEEWKTNLKYLESLNSIKIPRCYCYEAYDKAEIWAFGDAGKQMICCTVYARFLSNEDQQLSIRLIYSKTFTVPFKDNHTIPELELHASCELSKMVKFVLEAHEIKFQKIMYFTDNAAVYEWIKRGAKNPTVYMKHRIDDINFLTDKKDWNWIPTEYMPADLGTKETSMTKLEYENEWFFPKLFGLPQEQWPMFEPNWEQMHLTMQQEVENRLDPKKVNSHLSLIYAGQFIYKLKEALKVRRLRDELKLRENLLKEKPNNKDLQFEVKSLRLKIGEEVERYMSSNFMRKEIEEFLIRQSQQESFVKELKVLQKHELLPVRHYLHRWLPWIDEAGVIRAKTRLSDSEKNRRMFGYDRIYPIVLAKDHELTKLIILKIHRDNKHMLVNNVENQLKSRFLIQHVRTTIKKTIKESCTFCIRYNTRPAFPLMGDIPSVRLGYYEPAFKFCIADIAGPVLVKVTRNVRAKRYIFVYSCLTTRGIHLELIEKLDSNSTLLALQNAINSKGAPERIVTDNGTNFVGANRIMKEEIARWNRALESKGAIKKPIEWDFGPARASHMQGAVESLIKLVKTAMKKVLLMLKTKTEILNDFALRAILLEVAGLLNNRPLTLAPMEDLDNEFLTPNSFLMLRSNFQEIPYSNDKMQHITKNWEDVKQFTAILWKHWLAAYLPTLMEREKWNEKVEPLKEGDIVVTVDTSVTESWRLGRILKVKAGSKDQVRQVEIILGKRNVYDKKSIRTRKNLHDLYVNERQSIVTRPATAVAKINFHN